MMVSIFRHKSNRSAFCDWPRHWEGVRPVFFVDYSDDLADPEIYWIFSFCFQSIQCGLRLCERIRTVVWTNKTLFLITRGYVRLTCDVLSILNAKTLWTNINRGFVLYTFIGLRFGSDIKKTCQYCTDILFLLFLLIDLKIEYSTYDVTRLTRHGVYSGYVYVSRCYGRWKKERKTCFNAIILFAVRHTETVFFVRCSVFCYQNQFDRVESVTFEIIIRVCPTRSVIIIVGFHH